MQQDACKDHKQEPTDPLPYSVSEHDGPVEDHEGKETLKHPRPPMTCSLNPSGTGAPPAQHIQSPPGAEEVVQPEPHPGPDAGHFFGLPRSLLDSPSVAALVEKHKGQHQVGDAPEGAR